MATHIIGWGMYVPEEVVDNDYFQRVHGLDTSDDWIVSRTGIKERRYAAPDQATSDLAYLAALDAIKVAAIEPSEIEFIIVATATPDHLLPSTACLVQTMLGIQTEIPAIDINMACTGFCGGLVIADSFIRSGLYSLGLVIGAETLSRGLDFTKRDTTVLFGDGAGAVIVQAKDEPGGILSTVLGSDGRGAPHLIMRGGGSRLPPSDPTFTRADFSLVMNGRRVFLAATRKMAVVAKKAINKAKLKPQDIDLVIPHQANLRIIKMVAKLLRIDMDHVFVNIQRYGNTSAATIAICICEAVEQGLLKSGTKVVLVTFGAGFTWGAVVIEWSQPPEPRLKISLTKKVLAEVVSWLNTVKSKLSDFWFKLWLLWQSRKM